MSGKRTLKKLQKRQDSARTRLEELYLRGADDEFLALAAEEIKDPMTSLLAAEWAEVAGRALRSHLGRADLGRLERLVPSLRRGGALLPELALAEAVLDLAAGRLEAAHGRLAALAGQAIEAPEGLLHALQDLAREEPLPGLQVPHELFEALRRIEAEAFLSTAADLEELARRLDAVRSAEPAEDAALRRILDAAGRCLSLVTDLTALEDKLRRLPESEPSTASSMVLGWLRGPGPLLAATLTAPGPSLLAPLHHTMCLRWRAVLEQVEAREGLPGLMALCGAADPRLLAGNVSLPGGFEAGLPELRKGKEARQLLASRRYRELASLLRSRSQTEPDSGALAELWTLELWALQLQDAEDDEEEGWLAESRESPSRQALARLQGMADELGRRIPAEQRTGVARWLCGALFELCERVYLGGPTARAALALLEHQPGDIGLLIAGVVGAVADGDAKTLRALKEWFPRGTVQGPLADLPIVQRLMVQVAREKTSTVIRSLDLLRLLFADGVWREIVSVVSWELSRIFESVLSEALFEAAVRGSRAGDRSFSGISRQLDRLRTVLAGSPGFSAMELAFDYCRPGPLADKRLQKFLADDPGLEGALRTFLLLVDLGFMCHHMPERARRARNKLARAVIERLDDRWELWGPAQQGLFMYAGKEHLPRLLEKIRQTLASPKLSPAGREHLERTLQRMGGSVNPPPPRTTRKPRRRPRAGTPQLQLEIG